jgi:flagellar basal body-associated protein FliL
MKKVLIIIALVAVLFAVENYTSEFFSSIVHRDKVTAEPVTTQDPAPVADFFPEFYRGIYLNVASA